MAIWKFNCKQKLQKFKMLIYWSFGVFVLYQRMHQNHVSNQMRRTQQENQQKTSVNKYYFAINLNSWLYCKPFAVEQRDVLFEFGKRHSPNYETKTHLASLNSLAREKVNKLWCDNEEIDEYEYCECLK